MEQNEMDRVFNWLKSLKSVHKISYDTMAKAIEYSAVGVSKAIKNQTLSKDQVRAIANHVGYRDHFDKLFLTNTNEKTPQLDVRFEEIIAEKVAEKLKPFIQQKTDDLLKVIGDLELDFLDLRNTQEEIKAIQEQTKQSIDNIQ